MAGRTDPALTPILFGRSDAFGPGYASVLQVGRNRVLDEPWFWLSLLTVTRTQYGCE